MASNNQQTRFCSNCKEIKSVSKLKTPKDYSDILYSICCECSEKIFKETEDMSLRRFSNLTCSVCKQSLSPYDFSSNERAKQKKERRCKFCTGEAKIDKDSFICGLCKQDFTHHYPHASSVLLKKLRDFNYSEVNLCLIKTLLHTKEDPNPIIMTEKAITHFKMCLFELSGHLCKYCGSFGDQLDFKIPLSNGGKYAYDNCLCACKDCTEKRGDMSYEDFLNSQRNP